MNTMMSVCAALNPPDDSHRAFVVLAHGRVTLQNRQERRQNSFLSNFFGSRLSSACSGVNVGCFSLFRVIIKTSFLVFYDFFSSFAFCRQNS